MARFSLKDVGVVWGKHAKHREKIPELESGEKFGKLWGPEYQSGSRDLGKRRKAVLRNINVAYVVEFVDVLWQRKIKLGFLF